MAPPPAPLAVGHREAPYWLDDAVLPLPPETKGSWTADMVVIGAGYTGLAAARALAAAGYAVTVLEAGGLGAGASTRNGGMAHPGLKHGADTLVRAHGDAGAAMWEASLDAFDGLEKTIGDLGADCGWQRTGHLELAHKPSRLGGLRRDADVLLSRFGQQVRVLDRDELAAEIGSSAYHGALLVEHSGAVHPAKWFAALADDTIAQGAQVRPGCAALGVERRRPGGFTVSTTAGAIACGDVLVATGAGTGRWMPWLQKRILPIGSYMIATEPLRPGVAAAVSPKGRMFFDTRNFLHYWRLSPDGTRMLFGGRTSFRPTTVAAARNVLYAAMVQIHPQLARVRITHSWGGKVDLTVDRRPHVGRDPQTGAAYVAGYAGTGVALSQHLGRLAGEWLAGGPRPPFTDGHNHSWRPVPVVGRVPALLSVAGLWYQAEDRWR